MANTKKNELAVNLDSLGVEDIPEMLDLINKKINSLKGEFPTSGNINVPFPDYKLIKDINSLKDLVVIHSILSAKKEYYDKSQKVLFPKEDDFIPFSLEGYSFEEWEDEIKRRIIEVRFKEDLERLEKAKELLERNLSAKDKLRKDLQEVASILTK